jgi:hypothetical protein
MLDLVKQEYDRTTKFIEGMVGISTSVRGWAVTVWGGLMTIAFTQKLPALALIAILGVIAFGVIDAYHTALYRQALSRARRLERITAKYYEALARGRDQPKAWSRASASLAANRFGFYSNLRAFRPLDLLGAAPRVFTVMYALLALAALAGALAIPTLSATAPPAAPSPSPSPSAPSAP